jgi:hypothetical protein
LAGVLGWCDWLVYTLAGAMVMQLIEAQYIAVSTM